MKTLEQIAAEATVRAFGQDGRNYPLDPLDVERAVLSALREATRPEDPPVSLAEIDAVWESAERIPRGMTELRDRYGLLKQYVEYLERQNAMLMREPEGVVYQQGRTDGRDAFWKQLSVAVGSRAIDVGVIDGRPVNMADLVRDALTDMR